MGARRRCSPIPVKDQFQLRTVLVYVDPPDPEEAEACAEALAEAEADADVDVEVDVLVELDVDVLVAPPVFEHVAGKATQTGWPNEMPCSTYPLGQDRFTPWVGSAQSTRLPIQRKTRPWGQAMLGFVPMLSGGKSWPAWAGTARRRKRATAA